MIVLFHIPWATQTRCLPVLSNNETGNSNSSKKTQNDKDLYTPFFHSTRKNNYNPFHHSNSTALIHPFIVITPYYLLRYQIHRLHFFPAYLVLHHLKKKLLEEVMKILVDKMENEMQILNLKTCLCLNKQHPTWILNLPAALPFKWPKMVQMYANKKLPPPMTISTTIFFFSICKIRERAPTFCLKFTSHFICSL